MRRIPVWALKPGMIVEKPVYDLKGRLLLNRGLELKKDYIHHLKRMDIPFIYVQDHFIPDVKVEDVILDETRARATNAVRTILEEARRQPPGSNLGLVFEQKQFEEIVDEIVDQLIDNPELMINMADIRSSDTYTFAHSVNVAVLALTIAIALGGFSRKQLTQIGSGSLLHDLGKIRIPMEILNKKGPLTREEFGRVQEHPREGYDIVSSQGILDKNAASIILQHHERTDGNGYPYHLQEEEISPLAKMVAIADVYDALTSDRPYRKGFPPHKALEIMETMGDIFDNDMLQALLGHIAAYPVGTFVQLSSGEVGIVVKNRVGFPRHPRVRIFFTGKDLEEVAPHEIDLVGREDKTVKKAFSEKEVINIIPHVFPLLKNGLGKGSKK